MSDSPVFYPPTLDRIATDVITDQDNATDAIENVLVTAGVDSDLVLIAVPKGDGVAVETAIVRLFCTHLVPAAEKETS